MIVSTNPTLLAYHGSYDFLIAFIAYQYFLHVVPTTYIAPRSKPLRTAQYSVTHYTRVLAHHTGTPGIFFKFDLDPLSLEIEQRTTSFIQLAIRSVLLAITFSSTVVDIL